MSRMKEYMMTQPEPTFEDKAEMSDLLRLALKSGFKYEYAQYANSTDYLLRVYSDDGELTAHVSQEQLKALGMEV